jgi:shikimate kinase
VADRHVVLIGLPRAGRTGIGRRLAAALERPFADTGELVELGTGRPLARLRRERGESEVRRLAGRQLAGLLGRGSPLVVSAPAAIEIRDEDRAALASSAVVFRLRGPVGRLGEALAPGQDVADRVVDVEPVDLLNGDRDQLVAGHILDLLAAGDLPGPIRFPSPDRRADADSHEAAPPRSDDELAALYQEVADMIVDVEPFHARDDPAGAIARHIIDQLPQGEADADAEE